MTLDSQRAAELARRSHESRRRRQRERLDLERVEEAFGKLETLEDAQRRLDRLGVWSAAGMLAGSVASAAVRSVEVWLRIAEAESSFEVVEALRADVRQLQAERDALAKEVERLNLEARRAS